ncbi:hypothetical protein D4R87_00385 [bacterium]|nr:MAG: hypothetical protein D4R87_00385 [bacterium]
MGGGGQIKNSLEDDLKRFFLERVQDFNKRRQELIKKLPTAEYEEVRGWIENALNEYPKKKTKTALVCYLNAVVDGDVEVFRLIQSCCGRTLFGKLRRAGLRKVEEVWITRNT